MKKKRLSAIFMALALCVSLSAATACSASDNGEKPGAGLTLRAGIRVTTEMRAAVRCIPTEEKRTKTH